MASLLLFTQAWQRFDFSSASPEVFDNFLKVSADRIELAIANGASHEYIQDLINTITQVKNEQRQQD